MASTSCSNFDISVARHVRESAAKEPTVELRDVWPSGGMSCEVEECTTPHFKNFPQYISHWRKRHIPDVRCLKCPGCTKSFDQRCQLINHMVHHHRQFHAEHVASSTSLERILNKRFKDPGMVRPRKFSKIDTTARDKAVAQRKKTTEEGHNIVFNHLDETPEHSICRGQYLDIDFNNNSSKIVTRW